MNSSGEVIDGRRTKLYPDPDPRKSGRIGYFCHVCSAEVICPRYGLPDSGFSVSAMTPGTQPRVIWVCSPACLLAHAATL